LVENEWHDIAEVFLYADRCSSPYIIYPFFIIGNLIGVSIMLNVLTVFFCRVLVSKLDDGGADGSAEATFVSRLRSSDGERVDQASSAWHLFTTC
jgi:hypothetical protein